MSANGSFEISSKGWLSLFGQRYVVRGNTDGTTTRRFSVGGLDKPIDGEARAWIADAIERLVRSGFGAEARVARIIAQQGPNGVLDEISRFGGAFTKARYFTLLFKQPRLDRPTAERALRQAGREIGSAFELARVLVAFAEVFPLDDTIAPAFIEATNSIGSAFEQSRVLLQVISSQPIDAATRQALLDTTGRIGSDHERGRVMSAMLREGALR